MLSSVCRSTALFLLLLDFVRLGSGGSVAVDQQGQYQHRLHPTGVVSPPPPPPPRTATTSCSTSVAPSSRFDNDENNQLQPAAASTSSAAHRATSTALADDPAYLKLAEQLQQRCKGSKIALTRKATSSQVHDVTGYKGKGAALVDLSGRSRVLSIEGHIAHVEPMCTMATLVKETLKHGLVPKVCPEFKSITVGGAVMGGALEASSHRYGQFQDTCSYLTVMLGNGTMVTCTPPFSAPRMEDGALKECSNSHMDLFNALSGSYGTLGLLLGAGVQLEPCSRYVKVSYSVYEDLEEGMAVLVALCASTSSPTFIEAIQLPNGRAVHDSRGSSKSGGSGGGGGTDLAGRASPSSLGAVIIVTGEWYWGDSKEVGSGSGGGGSLSNSEGTINMGSGGSRTRLPVIRTMRPGSLWYYEHVVRIGRKLLKEERKKKRKETDTMKKRVVSLQKEEKGRWCATVEELIPTADFMFRYERGCFWMARPLQFEWRTLTPVVALLFFLSCPFPVLRLLFGWMYTATNLYKTLHGASPKAVGEKMIACDLYTPLDAATALIRYVRTTVPITTPLWVCPIRGPTQRQPFGPSGHRPGELMVNIGIYGRTMDGRGQEHSARLEAWTTKHGGRKMLYSQNYYTEEEFWGGELSERKVEDEVKTDDEAEVEVEVEVSKERKAKIRQQPYLSRPVYDLEEYIWLRKMYSADGVFPDLYSKVGHKGWGEDRKNASVGTRFKYKLSQLLL